jgi:hypothetical protein
VISLAIMLATQVVVPGGQGRSIEERVAILAESAAANSGRVESVVFDDPTMRAEVRRVGFKAGCMAVAESSREVINRHLPLLRPYAVQAVRAAIPEQRLAEATHISFIAPPLTMYSGRVKAKLDEIAAGPIAAARADMRAAFLKRTAKSPDSGEVAEQSIKPRQDISAALGLNGRWDFNNPAHMSLACMELRISPAVRPKISGGSG